MFIIGLGTSLREAKMEKRTMAVQYPQVTVSLSLSPYTQVYQFHV